MTTRERKFVRTLVIFVAVLLLVFFPFALSRLLQPRISEANAARVRPGVTTRAEVEAILGPPGDYTLPRKNAPAPPPLPRSATWHDKSNDWETRIEIRFDAAGRAEWVDAYSIPLSKGDEGPLSNLFETFRTLYHRWFT